MIVQLTFEKKFEPNCDGCKHCKITFEEDNAYGATKSFRHEHCAVGDENCIKIDDLQYELDVPKDWVLINTEVK